MTPVLTGLHSHQNGLMGLANLVPADAMPYTAVTGKIYDSGDYPELLRKALALIDHKKFVQDQAKARKEGRLLGFGISMGVEPGGSNLSYGMLISGPTQLLSGQGEVGVTALQDFHSGDWSR